MVFHDFARSMEEQEIVASVTQLVFAGNETTAKLMASTLVALAQHPDQRRALTADRSLIPQAIEEVLRWMTVVTNLQARHACSPDSHVQGIPIPVGAAMAPLVAAANRDPARWDNPHAFDIFRPAKQHLGFGFGMHVCLGLNLARLETEIWLDRLLDRLPDYTLAAPIDYGRSFLLRGPVAVPVAAG
jgi:cytochrome P450